MNYDRRVKQILPRKIPFADLASESARHLQVAEFRLDFVDGGLSGVGSVFVVVVVLFGVGGCGCRNGREIRFRRLDGVVENGSDFQHFPNGVTVGLVQLFSVESNVGLRGRKLVEASLYRSDRQCLIITNCLLLVG